MKCLPLLFEKKVESSCMKIVLFTCFGTVYSYLQFFKTFDCGVCHMLPQIFWITIDASSVTGTNSNNILKFVTGMFVVDR